MGQGECTVCELSDGTVIVSDCGSGNRKNIGENVIIPYLKYEGIGRVDFVLLSHSDEDHVNGFESLDSEDSSAKHLFRFAISNNFMQILWKNYR